jgi:predicted transcriptional regulator
MANTVRFDLKLSPALVATVNAIAADTGSTRTDVVRQAFALLKAVHEAKARGLHVGFAADPSRLDTAIVGIL